MRLTALLSALVFIAAARPASADPICRAVELHFAPGAPDLQIAVWIEDTKGKFIDTAYVTRLTGQFGLANRPGSALLKTDFGWPYGRREMVLPIWAHHRNHPYPLVVMGGVCGNSMASLCPGGMPCAGACDDTTIAYHSAVSSPEPFYCSPSGASQIDAMTCASKGTFSKGAYAAAPAMSLYPPRADLMAYEPNSDSVDILNFPKENDLGAVSSATPPAGMAINPAVTWFPPNGLADGDYVAWIELSQESDFNNGHNANNPNFQNVADTVQAWDFEGHQFLGQPSIVYKVQFHEGPNGDTEASKSYFGYGDYTGATGTLHAADNTITDMPGTGAGRLLDMNNGGAAFRFQAIVGGCPNEGGDAATAVDMSMGPIPDGGVRSDLAVSGDGGSNGKDMSGQSSNLDMSMGMGICEVLPDPVTALALTSTSSTISVSFKTPTGGFLPTRYEVRYRQSDQPITDAEFDFADAALDPVTPAGAGAIGSTEIMTLQTQTTYTVAVRGVSACNKDSPAVSMSINTKAPNFAVLHGCFVATAAYGSPLAEKVNELRHFRDQHLLDNPAGRLFVAAYYAVSPSLANAIATDRRARSITRDALAPLVEFVERDSPVTN